MRVNDLPTLITRKQSGGQFKSVYSPSASQIRS